MKSIIHSFLLLFILIAVSLPAQGQQRVGLVLSGGGATGFAHIGVLEALEEKNIPIDFITGSSVGALVGALYAAGYTPAEIKEFALRKDFLIMSTGGLRPDQQFLIKREEENSSMLNFSFSKDSIFQKSLPTNFTESTFLDFELMKILGIIGSNYNNNFDNLFVPFRCLASDIVSKQNVVFRSGPLNEAVRASMTFPFYFQPLRIQGRLLFDGGLYNNFPADVLYQEFSPDYIIGSNVSYNAQQPTENDLISQLINMLVSYSDFTLPCEQGMLIEPKLDISTFEFEKVEGAIQAGYLIGLQYADSILQNIDRRQDSSELAAKRALFREKVTQLSISKITVDGPKGIEPFVQKSLQIPRKRESLKEEELEKRYYRLAATEHIDFMFPVLRKNELGTYDMNLTVRKANEIKVDVGGHISSRPVNTGYFGLTYLHLRKRAYKFHASTYFGKFYGSILTSIKIEFPSLFPVIFEPYFVQNRWDYFRSFATFFEDVKPSFLVQNERYTGFKMYHPLANNIKSTYDFRYFMNEDDYYQTDNFNALDTSDITTFQGLTLSWQLKQNSLNRKQFANSGHYFGLKVRYVSGHEKSISGSTSPFSYVSEKDHQWINLSFDVQTFIIDKSHYHLGLQGKATFNSQSLFANYTASILSMTTFDLNPDAETYFLPEYRSPLYFGGGLNNIFTLSKSLDLRFDGFLFQPLVQLSSNDDGTFGYSKPFKGGTLLASTSLIYNSFFGPIRGTINYFPKQINPIAIQFSVGYVLFNERSIR